MAVREPRTRELWWHGIPPRARPEVWKRAITNELGLTPTTYEKALARVRAVEASFTASATAADAENVPKEIIWMRAIQRDVLHALPGLHLFQPTQPLHTQLIDLLSAYSLYRSDIGYVFGTHLPAALLLLTMPSTSDAFTCLANLLNRPLPLAFLTGDPNGTSKTYDLTLKLLESKRPKLHSHLFGPESAGGLALDPAEIFEPMIRTLFLHGCCSDPAPPKTSTPLTASFNTASFPSPSLTSPGPSKSPSTSLGLSLQLVQRLWDIISFDGDAAIIRTCGGILAAKESALYGTREEVLRVLGWNGNIGLAEGASVGFGLTERMGMSDDEALVEGVVGCVRGIGKEGKK